MPGSFRSAFCIAVLCLLGGGLTRFPASAQNTPPGRVVLDVPSYPLVFELDSGETMTITRGQGGKTLSPHRKVDFGKARLRAQRMVQRRPAAPPATRTPEVVVEVSGRRVTLLHRPYQMPVAVHGLRLYVETIREWAENAEIADLKDVRSRCGWPPARPENPGGRPRWFSRSGTTAGGRRPTIIPGRRWCPTTNFTTTGARTTAPFPTASTWWRPSPARSPPRPGRPATASPTKSASATPRALPAASRT
jgi:hypothetical protein